ncbi:unnamed protein product [Brassica oleracea var. botrytis]|uniref:Uncharacterized protein n=2 Tax=Brassica TaxID=3705 RepID=A0A3P6BUL8_BRAOL|nr:unnamed protein product [Brassica napus]CDY54110.1 BnaC04g53890D [Brassica napus]VDD06446.1 unnamed protein product [Brassica oleracea]
MISYRGFNEAFLQCDVPMWPDSCDDVDCGSIGPLPIHNSYPNIF